MNAVLAMLTASSVGFGAATGPAPLAATWVTVNSVATGEQRAPAIATNRNGQVAVVWEDDRDTSNPASNLRSEIFMRYYKDGNPVFEKKVSDGGNSAVTTWRHIMPDVGVDDAGNTVVVWANDNDGNGYYNIQYRVLSPTGTVRASGQANSNAVGQQTWPKVSVDPDGTPGNPSAVAFTIVWEDQQGGNPSTVRAAGFTNLTTKAYEVTASQTTGRHRRPDVAVPASGDAIVVWDEDRDNDAAYSTGLVRLARSNGAVNLSRRRANANVDGQQLRPAVAANFNGDFAVAWESDHTGITGVWARTFTATGAAQHTDVEMSSGAGARAPAVGIDDQNNSVVGWTVSGVDTWAGGLNPDGTGTGRLTAQGLMRISSGEQAGMVVAVSAWGEVSVAYRDDHDGSTWGQIDMGQGITNSSW